MNLLNFFIVLFFNLVWIFILHDGDVVKCYSRMLTFRYLPKWYVILIWIYEIWGILNLIFYLVYKKTNNV
jgi:hypothetical protein